jgi:epoxyqueuosine reductase
MQLTAPTPNQLTERNRSIKSMAQRLGFDACGIAQAMPLDEDARRLEQWLLAGHQGSMQYMERHFDLRTDPTKLVPGARSVITLLYNYYPEQHTTQSDLKISKYAYGIDYHYVIRNKLNAFMHEIETEIGAINGRGFVDSAPVLERSWAQRSGLGWVGKNGNLINKQKGSFFFLATLITDLAIEPDQPFATDHCGTCTRCIDACPTEAILPGPVIAGNKCISYFTIELKEKLIPADMTGKFDGWLFGCDVCQDVCPWNRFSKPTQEPAFTPIPGILNLSTKDWDEMSEEVFRKMFKDSPLKRTGYEGIKRNLRFIQGDTSAS